MYFSTLTYIEFFASLELSGVDAENYLQFILGIQTIDSAESFEISFNYAIAYVAVSPLF